MGDADGDSVRLHRPVASQHPVAENVALVLATASLITALLLAAAST